MAFPKLTKSCAAATMAEMLINVIWMVKPADTEINADPLAVDFNAITVEADLNVIAGDFPKFH